MKKLLFFAIATVPVSSATINVLADQPTIQAGIDATLDGDAVRVEPVYDDEGLLQYEP